MSISATQSAALRAGLRTAEQTLTMGLGVLTGGGALAGATDWFSVDWRELGGALAFVLLTSFFAGLKAYLSFLTNGVPDAYTGAAKAQTALAAAVVPPVPAPTVEPLVPRTVDEIINGHTAPQIPPTSLNA